MLSVVEQWHQLQQDIDQANDAESPDEAIQKLYFMQSYELFHVEYYGSFYDDTYLNFLQTLCLPDVAKDLKSLMIRGPDEGANGTRNWDLTTLLDSEVEFPNLTTLYVEPTAPEHHNQSIIAVDYEEEGQLGRLLAKMPQLQVLTVPSAPDAGFFQREVHPLASLRVDSGFDHQNFVTNLSDSSCFPQLRMLDFGDYNQRYVQNYWEDCTPMTDYEKLFQSQAFQSVAGFYLRNSVLTAEQLAKLRTLNKEVQFFVIQAHGEYIREERGERLGDL